MIIAAVAAMLASCSGNNADKAGQDAVETLTDDNAFRPDTKVDRLTVLDFNATWCGPCKQLSPVFDQAAKAFADARFVSVDVDRNPATAQAFEVEAVPTVVFIKPDGTSVRYVGTDELLPYEALAAIVQSNL